MRKKTEKSPIQLTNAVLKDLYTKLKAKCEYSIYNITNRDHGCYNDSHDYVQETLITLLNKDKDGKVSFKSMSALWSWCSSTLSMLLLRYHRDYTIVQSRAAKLIDIQGETLSGNKVENVASMFESKASYQPDQIAQENEYEKYVLAYTTTNAEIVSYSQLYTLDSSYTLVSLARVMENIKFYGVYNGLKLLDMHKKTIAIVVDAICDYLGIDEVPIESKSKIRENKKILNSREQQQLKQVKEMSSKNNAISLDELRSLICLNNSLNP